MSPPASNCEAIITIADSIALQRALTDTEDEYIRSALTDAERVEFLSIASLCLGISALCHAFGIPREPGTPALPAKLSSD